MSICCFTLCCSPVLTLCHSLNLTWWQRSQVETSPIRWYELPAVEPGRGPLCCTRASQPRMRYWCGVLDIGNGLSCQVARLDAVHRAGDAGGIRHIGAPHSSTAVRIGARHLSGTLHQRHVLPLQRHSVLAGGGYGQSGGHPAGM